MPAETKTSATEITRQIATAPKLHHIGYVVRKIENVIQGFARSLDAVWDGRIIHDPLQRVSVAFLQSRTQADPMIELVAPEGEVSPVTRFLSQGGGLHHLCYEVEDLEAQLTTAKAVKSAVARSPMPAVAFEGRRIAWVLTEQKLLIEYLERAHATKGQATPAPFESSQHQVL